MMKGHLKYAASEYVQEADDRGVRPISGIDGEIITEIIGILYDKGESKVAKMLDQWKAVDDATILDRLLSYREGIDIETGEDQDETSGGKTKDFIEVQDVVIEAIDIFSIKKNKYYNGDRGMVYCITINGIDDAVSSIKGVKNLNVIIEFFSESQRDLEIDSIKSKLKEFKNCRFL